MSGFKAFLLRGNLVELAVAFIMGAAFATVIKAFTDVLMAFIGKAFGTSTVGSIMVSGVDVAPFVNALIAFVLLALVVYFAIVVPYTKARTALTTEAPETPSDEVALLTEIRDALTTDKR
ncbi:MAG: MscL family protein [Micrococcales bacterium]|nr:MscL family protein [Micrococcales bacterium]